MNLIDQLNQLWSGLLQFLTKLVVPDWGALIGLLPVFVVIGVLAPILSLLALGWFLYVVRRPRARLTMLDGAYAAPLDADGRPVYSTGEPYCARDGLIFPGGSTICDRCRDELAVTCPKCIIGRQARITTCANCGLILQISPNAQSRALRPAGPPPGGAAVA